MENWPSENEEKKNQARDFKWIGWIGVGFLLCLSIELVILWVNGV